MGRKTALEQAVEQADERTERRQDIANTLGDLQIKVLDGKDDPEAILKILLATTAALTQLQSQGLQEVGLIWAQRQVDALEQIARNTSYLAGIESALQEMVNTWSSK